MKQIPVKELIEDKKLLFVDDSIVRGTQLKETVDFLYESGAKKCICALLAHRLCMVANISTFPAIPAIWN